MNNKKIGVVLLIITLILIGVFYSVVQSIQSEGQALGCFEHDGCLKVEKSLNIIHFAFGIFGFLLALSVYLLFFSQGELAIVRRLEQDSKQVSDETKFSILLAGLSQFEQDVIVNVQKQDGILQSTLKLRVNMSKAKLSQVLSDLEHKGLITRKQEGKTNRVYIKLPF